MKKAVFIDRDGTINKEVSYLSEIEDIHILPGVCEGICHLVKSGFMVIVVTNQSGVARGYFDEKRVHEINMAISSMLNECGAVVHAWFYCPHHPEGSIEQYRCECSCRKPEPGMILQAAEQYGIECGASFMIGDTLRDLEAGAAAGCVPVLVKTGYGMELIRSGRLRSSGMKGVAVFNDLNDAAEWIVRQGNPE